MFSTTASMMSRLAVAASGGGAGRAKQGMASRELESDVCSCTVSL
jgi:hypothetical protein